ncbi:MAG: hypothetical protein QXT73_05970 [Candidatus Methanomethylicaceae archaeon]
MAQCPNCGGFKVGYQRPASGEGCLWVALLIAGLIISSLVRSIRSGLPPIKAGYINGLPLPPILDWIVSIACLGGLALLILTLGFYSQFPKAPHLLRCYLCGYEWDSRTNPKVTVRPDLIIKGEEKLRAEAEEERKRQEAAWWSWWSQQQRKK